MKKLLLSLIILSYLSLTIYALKPSARWLWSPDLNITNSPSTTDIGPCCFDRTLNNAEHQFAIATSSEYPIHVVWGKQPLDYSDYYRLYYKRLTSNGWSNDTLLTPAPLKLHSQFPSFSIATNADGNYVCVVWHEEMEINAQDICSIYMKFSDDGGITWSEPYRVSQYLFNGHYYYTPDVTIGNNGNIFITWCKGWLGVGADIGLAHYVYNGPDWETEYGEPLTKVNYLEQIDPSLNVNTEYFPSIATDPNNSYVHIAWLQVLTDETYRIIYRNYNSETMALGPVSEIVTQPAYNGTPNTKQIVSTAYSLSKQWILFSIYCLEL